MIEESIMRRQLKIALSEGKLFEYMMVWKGTPSEKKAKDILRKALSKGGTND